MVPPRNLGLRRGAPRTANWLEPPADDRPLTEPAKDGEGLVKWARFVSGFDAQGSSKGFPLLALSLRRRRSSRDQHQDAVGFLVQ